MFAAPALAEEKGKKKRGRVEAVAYDSEGRRDPFLSILESAKQAEKETDEEEGKLPIENYDISNFNLIAIVWEETQHMALVGLPDDKY
jgi:Tfp pilus assembly protein PilP